MSSIGSDWRHAARALRRRPGYTLTAVSILALGIGAGTAVFSVVDAVLLRSLPYRDMDRLVVVWADGTARGMSDTLPTTPGTFLDWREQSGVFEGLAALRNMSARITSLEQPVVPLVHGVTADYFDVLGVHALHGRGFLPGEDDPGAPGVVILAYALWQSAFGGDPEVVGRHITLDDVPHEVVGVMPADFFTAHAFAVQPGLWVPFSFAAQRDDRRTRDVIVYGRLSASADAAQQSLDALSARLAEAHPATEERWGTRLVPLREHAVGRFSRTFGLLLAAVGLVLLIACANVANLTLARANERGRELALRAAIGASRRRVVGPLVVESLLLALLGGAAGLALAHMAAPQLARLIPAAAGVPFLDEVRIDGSVAAFALAMAVLSGLLAGLAPAREALRTDLAAILGAAGRGSVAGSRSALRGGLVVAEVALAMIVAAVAGLLIQSFARLQSVEAGFDADRVLKLRMSLRGEEYATPARRQAHFEELQRRLAALPGVVSASGVSFEPPIAAGVFGSVRISLPGRVESEASPTSAVRKIAMPGYFETMGIPVRRGRGIEAGDGPGARPVVAINEEMARRYFDGVDPIGRSFSVQEPGARPLQIVGVVGNVMTAGTRPESQPAFYLPHAQAPISILSMVMRVSEGDPLRLAREAERTAWSTARSANVYAIETLEQRIADLNWRSRFGALLLGGFAALALLLGAAGIYAVISCSVAQRRPEIGVRLALGAAPRSVLGMIVGDAVRLAATGVALGGLAALALGRLLAGRLYGIGANDPVTLAGVALGLLAVAVAASLLPALRAMRTDPVTVLRE